MNIDQAIRLFAVFLDSSWNIVKPLLYERAYTSSNMDSVNDWTQANWEILVEYKVLEGGNYFEVYGSGADLYKDSSRITDIHKMPTHAVGLKAKKFYALDILNGEKCADFSHFEFEELVGFNDKFYFLDPPFEYVLVRDRINKIERVFSIKEVEFEIKKISS